MLGLMGGIELVAALLALVSLAPALLFALNMGRYRTPRFGKVAGTQVAVLIATRDEEETIGACLEHVLASEEVELEVIVGDCDSADRTARVVEAVRERDARVRLMRLPRAPRTWAARLFSYWQMANSSTAPYLLFLEGNVGLDAWAIARCVAHLRLREAALVSGFPRLRCRTFAERLLLPLIQFELLSWMPLGRMRKSARPLWAAGSSEFQLVERYAYFASGGHAAMQRARHVGVVLPRLLREHGFATDVVDLTRLAEVKTRRKRAGVWKRLARNAAEGMGRTAVIVPLSALMLAAQVLPCVAAMAWLYLCVANLVAGATFDDPIAALIVTATLAVAVLASLLPRVVAARRFKQSKRMALLHPVSVCLLLAVQWYGWLCERLGRPVGLGGREYSSAKEVA